MNSNEFVETSAKSKRKLIALSVAAAFLWAAQALFLRPALFAYIKQLPACGQAEWSFGLLIGSLGMLPVVGLWGANYARKLLKHGQYPLPNAWVWRRTLVMRGRMVRLRAYGIMFCSIAFFAIFFYGWYVLWPMVAAISSRCAA